MSLRSVCSQLFCICLTIILAVGPAYACGPFANYAVFSYDLHPDFPLKLYAGGKLGILQTTYARSYLYAAYRTLTKRPLNPAQQAELVRLWESRLNNDNQDDSVNGVQQWLKARSQLGLKEKVDWIGTYKWAQGDEYYAILNCPKDALLFATKTLGDLVKKYGVANPSVKEWVKGQDAVFCNCDGYGQKISLPPALGASAETWLKQARAYQDAAAQFYFGNFDQASSMFAKIAQDKTSPYSTLSAYLVQRCKIRQATTAKVLDTQTLTNVLKELKLMLAEPSFASFKESIAELTAFVQFKISPQERFKELDKDLSESKDSRKLADKLYYYTVLFDNIIGDDSGGGDSDPKTKGEKLTTINQVIKDLDMASWIYLMQCEGTKAYEEAHSRWQKEKTNHWLLATLSLAGAKEAKEIGLLQAAASVAATDPAYENIQFQLSRLLVESGDKALAKKNLDSLIKVAVGPSYVNELIWSRLPLCTSFKEFKTLAVQYPAGLINDSMGNEVPDDFLKLESSNNYPKLAPCFSEDTVEFLNSKVPLSLLFSLPEDSSIVGNMKADMWQTLFVRAALLGDLVKASQAASALKVIYPFMAPQLDTWEKAKTPADRQFALAFLLIKNPGLQPFFRAGAGRQTKVNRIDDYQDNYWEKPIKGSTPASNKAPSYTACLSSKELSQGAAEVKIITEQKSPAVLVLGNTILNYAKTHSGDSRIPEALHLTVKASKFCERTNETSQLSKAAFVFLHQKYPRNPWTAKTAYYY